MMLPKLCGTDVELGNFVLGLERPDGTGAIASRALLRKIDGYPRTSALAPPARSWPATTSPYGGTSRADGGHADARYDDARYGSGGGRDWLYAAPPPPAWNHPYSAAALPPATGCWCDPQDWGRKYLVNGGCAYIDLDHLELASPETLSAFDQVACVHAMLRVAQAALAAANAEQPRGRKVLALVNNSDGRGNSYGSHVNFLVTRETWDNIFCRRLQLQLALAAFQASSIVFTGQGKVGSENGAPPVPFQISQRADFFETLSGFQTTYRRPIVNSRDEPLCGRSNGSLRGAGTDQMARLHVIFFDSTLCHVSALLKFGTMQIVLAMIEAGRFNASLILDDPLDAVVHWSHDPTLQAKAALADGRRLTAVELQSLFLDEARRFVDSGAAAEVVPRAAEIVALWESVLADLRAGNLDALEGQIDWVLKQSILRRVIAGRPSLTWESPQIKHLDLLYSSLDPGEGLYWACARDGGTQEVVSDAEIERLTTQPPGDTRAWTRGTLLRLAGGDAVESVDWDCIRLRSTAGRRWGALRSVRLDDPLRWTAAEMGPVLETGKTIDSMLDELEARQPGAVDAGAARDAGTSRWHVN